MYAHGLKNGSYQPSVCTLSVKKKPMLLTMLTTTLSNIVQLVDVLLKIVA